MSRTMRLGLLLGLLAWSAATLSQPDEPDAAGTGPDEVAAESADGAAETAQEQEEEPATPAEDEPAGAAEEEFTPSEEISEDYAVPLPSDI